MTHFTSKLMNKVFISKANEDVEEVEVIAFKFTDEDTFNCFILEGHILYCAKFPSPRVSNMCWYTANALRCLTGIYISSE